MHGNSDEVRKSLTWVALHLSGLRGVRPENCGYINRSVFQHYVGCRDSSEVATRSSVRHPRCGRILTAGGEHVWGGICRSRRGRIKKSSSPVGERNPRVTRAIGIEVPE